MRRAGFTLMELMVGLAVMGIAVVYMLESVTVGNRTYTVLDQVVESQQNLRAVAKLLEHDLRHAGLMVPVGAAICGVDNTASPDLLYVSDSDAIDPRDDIAPYDGALITGGVTNVTGTIVTLGVDSLILEPNPPVRGAYDVNGDGTLDSDFQVGGGVIIMDLEDPGRGTVCGRIDSVSLTGPSITIDPVVTPGLSAPMSPAMLSAVKKASSLSKAASRNTKSNVRLVPTSPGTRNVWTSGSTKKSLHLRVSVPSPWSPHIGTRGRSPITGSALAVDRPTPIKIVIKMNAS